MATVPGLKICAYATEVVGYGCAAVRSVEDVVDVAETSLVLVVTVESVLLVVGTVSEVVAVASWKDVVSTVGRAVAYPL